MSIPTIGFIGFGEAAFLISEGLKAEGVQEIIAFDANASHPAFGSVIRERAEKLNIPLSLSLEILINSSDYIFCATSAKVAEVISKEASMYLSKEQIYIDINATSPMVKQNIAVNVEKSGAMFVDAAVMESVPLRKHKVPMIISGSGAKSFQQFGTEYGMNLTFISEKAGSASAIKMFRSVFMKGFTMLLFETLQSSTKYGVAPIVMESINETLTQKSLEEMANMLITRTAIHAERRVAEMSEVVETLNMLEVDSSLSQAVKNKLSKLAESDLADYFQMKAPEHYNEVFLALEEK